jgi:hypothetical protein
MLSPTFDDILAARDFVADISRQRRLARRKTFRNAWL